MLGKFWADYVDQAAYLIEVVVAQLSVEVIVVATYVRIVSHFE